MMRRWGFAILCFATAFGLLPRSIIRSAWADRPRVIVTTDGEIDDRCSMVRFLLYADQWDIEGIIYSSSKFHWRGHNWAGEQWIQRDIDLYAKCYPKLKQHSLGFPTPEQLKRLVFVGNVDQVGDMSKDTPGSDRIVQVLLDDDPRRVYLQAWGGTNTIARALWKIQHTHPEAIPRVTQKAIIYIILDQDKTFRQYIQPNWPQLEVLGSFRQFAAVAYNWRRIIPQPLHRFFDGAWMKRNILQGHGPLCSAYEAHKDGSFRSEGDSPSYWHEIDVGLGNLEHPSYGGWGGRFEPETGSKNVWCGAKDDGDLFKPLWRWVEAIQNDFAARADWCVKRYDEANHRPQVVVNGQPGTGIIRVTAERGGSVFLSAAGSSDPDGDRLVYHWWFYPEPSTPGGKLQIADPDAVKTSVRIPADAPPGQYHVLLTVKDNGSPNLFAYRRVIVTVRR